MANLPGWAVLGLREPAGTGSGGQGTVFAGELDVGPRSLCGGGGSGGERGYRSKTGLALEMLEQAVELGHLRAGWVAQTTPSACRRPFCNLLHLVLQRLIAKYGV